MESPIEFLGETRAYANVRPRRLGYLVRQGDYRHLDRAVEYATSEWGGWSQPILPVKRQRMIEPRWLQFAEVLRPEVLIDYVGVSETLKSSLARDLHATVISPPTSGQTEPGVHTTVVHGRDSLRGRTILVPREEATYAEKLALGVIPPDWRGPWNATGASIEAWQSIEEFITAQLGTRPSPLSLTRAGTGAYETSGFGGPVMVFTGRLAPWDLLTFWNVRAATITTLGRVHVLYIPLDHLADPMVGVILRDLSLQQMSVPDVVFHGRKAAEIKNAGDSLGFEEGAGGVRFTISHPVKPRDLASNPFTYRINLDPRTWVLSDRKDGVRTPASINLTRPTLHFRTELALPLQPYVGFVRVDLQEIPTLRWPVSARVGHLIHADAELGPLGLSFLERPSRVVDKTLRVPSAQEVATALLLDRNTEWRVSDKGRYAQSLINRVGPVEGLGSLSSVDSIRIIVALASLRRRRASRILQDAGISVSESVLESLLRDLLPSTDQRWRSANEVAGELAVSKKSVIKALTQLVRDGLVNRGLGFKCPHCTLRTAIPIDRATDHVACDGCGTASAIIGPSDSEPEIRYTLNSLFDRVVEQDCLSHLLMMPVVERRHASEWALPGALVTSPEPALNREIDLLAVSRERLIMGEAKATSAAFTDEEVADNIRLAQRLGAGLLVLSTLDDWPAQQVLNAEAAGDAAGVETVCYGIRDLLPAGQTVS